MRTINATKSLHIITDLFFLIYFYCIIELKDVSQPGSGYSGKSSPHTKYEDFNGLTIGKLTEVLYFEP